MADDLPSEFDLVVVGTGFTESCIAAAASRVGKTVLHIDKNEFYGGAWASFSLENFIALLKRGKINDEVQNASYTWHIPKTSSPEDNNTETEASQTITQDKVMEQSRRFNLDLTSKILYSAGRLVQLLISSNICRYAEFRAVDHVCTLFHGNLIDVPCSRADVFNSRDLNIVEKRILMKVLNDCLVYGEEKHDEDTFKYRGKTFREYLKSQKVTEKISTCIMQAIAMCNDETCFEVGMERTKKFLSSLGRYGNTPFLFPMYGCGEVPQCFCRLCAVFGGIYCLKTSISDIILNADTNSIAIMFQNGKNIQTKHMVCSHGLLPIKLQEHNTNIYGYGKLINSISRGLFIATSPLGDDKLNGGGGGVNLLRLVDGMREAFVVQLSHYSGTCPKNYYIFHLTTSAMSSNPSKDLQPFLEQIFNDKPHAPNIIFSAYFTITGREASKSNVNGCIPICSTAAPYYELDYDRSIENANEIFNKIYANAEFLPRAPDPEEIVIDGEDPRALSEVGLPEDLRAHFHELECAAGGMNIDEQMDAE